MVFYHLVAKCSIQTMEAECFEVEMMAVEKDDLFFQ